MNSKIKILIGVLVVGILVIGGLFIVNNQFKEAELLMNETVINFEIKEVLPIYESSGWHIYELYQDNWREIEISCSRFGCRIYGCENGNPIKMCADPGPPICRKIDNKISFKFYLLVISVPIHIMSDIINMTSRLLEKFIYTLDVNTRIYDHILVANF